MGPRNKSGGDGGYCSCYVPSMIDDDSWIATYILTNRPYGVLYVGVTSRLPTRMIQHREKVFPGFSAEHGLTQLVWFETFERITTVIQREKTLKHWSRDWKINLIERENRFWDDLYPTLFVPPPGPLSHLNPPP